jgi:4-carboxymuconolactone decarboxylase
MARIPSATTRDTLSPEAQASYDRIIADRGRLSGPTAQLLPYAPEMAERVSHLGTYVRFETDLNRAQTELATIVAARGLNNAYIWAAHVPPALEEGVAASTVEVVNRGGAVDGLDPTDALIIRVARALVEERHLDAATFEAAKTRFGEKGLLELTTLVGFYSLVACIITTGQFTPREGAPLLIER